MTDRLTPTQLADFDRLCDERFKGWVEELRDFCTIPCETDQFPELELGAQWVEQRLRAAGAQVTVLREEGVLKRMRGTPLPPWAFVAGVIGSSILVSIVLALLTTGFGILAYSVHVPEHIGAAAAVRSQRDRV